LQSIELSFPLISVVICTYNRVDMFVDALITICNQTLDASFYEVIIVDNNSSDNTAHVAKDFCERFPTVRYCLESKQGLSHARNRGWQEAKGRYVAYIDDDCKVPKTWLVALMDTIERISPGAFGGPIYAFFNSPRPRWYKNTYGSYEPLKEPRILRGNDSLYIKGGNMCFRRILLEALGGFDVTLGMSGKNLAYNEETELILRMVAAFPNEVIYYHPDLYLYHLVREEKMRLLWYFHAWFAIGQYSVCCADFLQVDTQSQLGKQILRHFVNTIKHLGRGLLCRDRIRYPYFQNYLYERGFVHLKKLGQLTAQYARKNNVHSYVP